MTSPNFVTLSRKEASDPISVTPHRGEECRTRWRVCDTAVRVIYQLRYPMNLGSFPLRSSIKVDVEPPRKGYSEVDFSKHVEGITCTRKVLSLEPAQPIDSPRMGTPPSLMSLHQHRSQAWRHEKHVDCLSRCESSDVSISVPQSCRDSMLQNLSFTWG